MALPCATQNEIGADDANALLADGVKVVCEGANMPTHHDATQLFLDAKILYVPGAAANAGEVAVSGLEQNQNSLRLSWPRERVDGKLHEIMWSR